MAETPTLVRRLTPGGYKGGQIQAKSFIDRNPNHEGLSFHEAVPAILDDRAERYCVVPGFSEPMGACLVPTGGVWERFVHAEDENDEAFGRWHHDLIPAPREETDPVAVELATRATERAEADGGLLREAIRNGKPKPFR